MNEPRDLFELRDMLILPDAQVIDRNAAIRCDGGGLGHYQPCATLCATAQVHQVPVIGEPVFRRVLAHRRNANAIGKRDGTQLKRRKKRIAHKWIP